jgi:hypothetical protein
MSARSASEADLPVAWPLAGSLILTTAVVAFVCIPPSHLHSWTEIFSRATLYLLVAGCVHALAVWGVCRVRDESEGAGLALIWGLIWMVWIAVVWLPLVALLTAEHSPWVAFALPMTAVFATLLLKWHASQAEVYDDFSVSYAVPSTVFQLLESRPLWRMLLPAVITSVAAELGISLLAAGHGWEAGCLFGAGSVYPVSRWLDRREAFGGRPRVQPWGRTAAGNSLTVWLLIVLALVPLMTGYVAVKLGSLLGIQAHRGSIVMPPAIAQPKSNSFESIILVQPKKPHEIVVPAQSTNGGTIRNTHVIPFDGAYWYFKQPNTQPAADAHVMRGDPVKRRMVSTDRQPMMMEAHQPLGQEIDMNCCRSLRLDVKNADNVPGPIAVEVLLRDRVLSKKTSAVSLGIIVLPSSTVSPMPLARPPVDDKVTFQLPRAAHGKTFNEITVRIKPEVSRSLAGAQVGIKDFVLQP